MTYKEYSIGRGKNMSIAKAALIYFYEKLVPEWNENGYLSWGDTGIMHEIVDIAGAQHRSFHTPTQVTARLARSPFWSKEFHRNIYRGFRGGQASANCLRPSKRGKLYYESKLKNRTAESNH